MKISDICIHRPVLTWMGILSLIVFGFISYQSIGVNMFPKVDIPMVTVTVINPGMAPETMDREVAELIEESVGTISGIKTLRSQSLEGITQVFIEFELEENVDIKAQDVRDKISLIRQELPPEIEEPTVEKLDLDSAPIMSILVSGPKSITQLTRTADERIKPMIETIRGVGNVQMVGDRDREIRIWFRTNDLRAYSLTAQDVTDAIRRENIEPPGGRIETGSRDIIVKTRGKIQKVVDFEQIIVKQRSQNPIRLGDVAYVEDGMEDCRGIARLNGEMAVCLQVRPQAGTNMVAVADKVKIELDGIREFLAKDDIKLTIAQDNSEFVNQSISEAEGELLRGAFLAVIVIFFFLRSIRGSFVAACTIPATIIGTYAFMYAMGFTVNMMTMLALTVSVGMIIDDSIVVLENTYRHMEEGHSRMKAALMAMKEIGFAVIVTSMAIAAVFLPVAFMKGIVGKFFFEFGLTVTAAVFISTTIAVTLSPMLCSRVLKITTTHGRFFNSIEAILRGIERTYSFLLNQSLRFRWLVVIFAISFFASSLYIAGFIGSEFMPQADENQFNIQVEAPIGTSIEASDCLLAEIERRIETLPGVTDIFTTIGSGVSEQVHKATVLVKLVPKAERTQSQFELMDQARTVLADFSQLDLSVEIVPRISASGYSVAPFQYYIGGTNLNEIVEFSEKMEKELAKTGMVVDIISSWNSGKPELEITPNRQKATLMGVSTEDISSAIYTLIGGMDVTTFQDNGESFDVRVRLAQKDRDRVDSVLSIPVRTGSGELIEIRNVVNSSEQLGPVQVDRRDRMRQVTLMANIAPNAVLGDAMTKAREVEAKIGVPAGLSTGFTGEAQDMEESFGYIFTSMFLAVLLIYMVLAAQFESFIHPFTIMITLPLSITGALGGLYLAGSTISIFSLIGMIMLIGLVTKNAILLIDYTNQLRAQGMERNDAIRRAGPVRLRPIMMTALSTIAGMLPAAIGMGEGAETRSPMGICIVGGMLTSTVLTLVVIPVVYTILDDISNLTKRLFSLAPAVVPISFEKSIEIAAKVEIPAEEIEEEAACIPVLEEKPILRLDSHDSQPSRTESPARAAERSQ